MFDPSKLTDYELDCLARRLCGDFIQRKLAVGDVDRLRHRYESEQYLDVFRAAVAGHHPRQFGRIVNGAFKAIADSQPEDLVGDEAVQRTMAARSTTDVLIDDANDLVHQLAQEVDWLKASLSFGEYRGQSVMRFLAIRQIDPKAVPASAIYAMAREMLLEAKIDSEVVDSIDRNLPGVDVFGALEEAAEIVENQDEMGALTE